jgi:hypothetical protein
MGRLARTRRWCCHPRHKWTDVASTGKDAAVCRLPPNATMWIEQHSDQAVPLVLAVFSPQALVPELHCSVEMYGSYRAGLHIPGRPAHTWQGKATSAAATGHPCISSSSHVLQKCIVQQKCMCLGDVAMVDVQQAC